MSTTTYNAIVEINDRPLDAVDRVVDELEAYSGAASASVRGRPSIIITLPATSLRQAAATALTVVGAALFQVRYAQDDEPVSVEVMTTQEFDARAGMQSLPQLLGSAEAAELLGVSRQRINQLVDAGQLQGQHVGRNLVLPRPAVVAFAARDRGPGRPKVHAR